LQPGEDTILKLFVLTAIAALAFSPAFEADAAPKKKTSSRAEYTKEQQAKFFADALKLCRQHFREVVGVKVDYKRKRYVCRGR
jgi:ribosomal protein S14